MPADPTQSAFPHAVLFDLDGTLVDTLADLAAAINATRADFELPSISPAIAAGYVGRGVGPFVMDALAYGGSGEVVASRPEALSRFRAHYRAVNGTHSALYPGVMDGLRQWREVSRGLAVVTNKGTEFTSPLLERMDLAAFFDLIVCGDTLARRKPDPDPVLYACRELGVGPANTLFIGDSINDALAARAAGVRALAVPYGYHGNTDVHELPVEAVVPDIASAVTWAAANW